jgi:transposase
MLSLQERKLIVKLHSQGKKQSDIANLLGCSQPTVHRWIRNYERGRTLQTLPRTGRPTKLTEKNLSLLKDRILSVIKSANNNFNSISTKRVAKIIEQEIGKAYSIRHVERIMHKLGFSLITPRSQHIRHDQKKVDEFRDKFKKNFSRSTWVMN